MQKKILLVEDDKDFALSIELLYRRYSYEFIHVTTGEKAVELVCHQNEAINLILMDINPGSGIDGLEAARRILESKEIPIVFLSDRDDPETIDKMEKVTPYGYVPENSGINVLDASIKMAFKLYESKIREQEKTEELKRKEERLSLAMDSADHVFWDWDIATGKTYFSPRYYTMLGYEPGELPMHFDTWADLLHPDNKDVIEIIHEHVKKAEPFTREFRLRCKDGTYKWIRGQGKSYDLDRNGQPARVVGIHIDITDRKRAEEERRQSDERFLIAQDMSPDGFTIFRPVRNNQNQIIDFIWVYQNAAVAKMNGTDPQEVVGRSFLEFFPGIKGTEFWNNYIKVSETGQPITFEDAYVGETMTTKSWFRIVVVPMGENIAILAHEITEQKKAEYKLKESEERFKALHNASFGGITIHDKGKILECNKGLANITGYSEEELLGMDGLLLIAEENRQKVLDNILSGNEKPYEAMGIRKNGEKYPLRLEAREIPYKGKLVRVVEFRDMTELKKTEQELLKMEKLRSLGNLAGGIAHDFNNLLTGIYGNVSIALEKLDAANPVRKYLSITEESIKRATKLTDQLLTFSKGGDPVRTRIDIGKLIKETVLFDLSGSNLKPRFDWPETESIAEADEGQMEQVISNLVINAQQAAPDGGPLYISLDKYSVTAGEIVELPPGDYWRISIRDEGTGIPPEYMDRIFDPYFSTKETGHGLGLATIYSIIKRHNGHITVQSEWGSGATFTIYLPSSETGEPEKEETAEKTDPGENPFLKVLIMDDERIIRETLSEMVSILGHEADTVSDGEEAIVRYKQAREENKPFDLVIMDLTVPGGMGGIEAVKGILEIDNRARVIVSSGYSGGGGLTDYRSSGFIDMIDKPYTMTKLKEILSRVNR
ncbi:MAG: PAS domain S-box protein [Spirochaetales bacterium]|nr:PAS domain S-box protein [Spirochaetales bacterium]